MTNTQEIIKKALIDGLTRSLDMEGINCVYFHNYIDVTNVGDIIVSVDTLEIDLYEIKNKILNFVGELNIDCHGIFIEL